MVCKVITMTETKNYLFCYIDEFDDDELIKFRDELLGDIEFLKIIKENYQLDFEYIRLGYVLDLIKNRNIEEKKLKLSM